MPTYAGVRVVGVPPPAPVSAALYCSTKNHPWAKGGCAQCGAPFAGIIRNRFSGSRAVCPPLSLDYQAPRKYWQECTSRAGACQSWRLNLVTKKLKGALWAALEWPRHAQRRTLPRACWSDAHLIEPADLGAEPNPDLEFDQTLGW